LEDPQLQEYSKQLEQLARRLNAFAKSIRTQKRRTTRSTKEPQPTYNTDHPLFTDSDLTYLSTIP
jgi:hypothetical protein